MKLLLLLAVVGLAIWLFKSGRRVPRPKAPPGRPAKQDGGATPMLACAHCGVHLPKSDALFDPAGRAYCSAAHQQAGPR